MPDSTNPDGCRCNCNIMECMTQERSQTGSGINCDVFVAGVCPPKTAASKLRVAKDDELKIPRSPSGSPPLCGFSGTNCQDGRQVSLCSATAGSKDQGCWGYRLYGTAQLPQCEVCWYDVSELGCQYYYGGQVACTLDMANRWACPARLPTLSPNGSNQSQLAL
jgi:hypothetical protein